MSPPMPEEAGESRNFVFILPGLLESATDAGYRAAGALFRRRDIEPVYVDVRWRAASLPAYLEEAGTKIDRRLAHHPGAGIYLFGFSTGAMLALALASRLQPQAQVLCSMAPFFAEDLPLQPLWLRCLTALLYRGASGRIAYPDLPDGLACRTTFLYGEQEARTIPRRVQEARRRRFTRSRTLVVPNGQHLVGQPAYQAQIAQVVRQL